MLDTIALFLSGDSVWVYIAVFFGKLAEVTLSSLRSQLIVKGQRLYGGLIAAVEYFFWFVIAANVLSNANFLRLFLLVLAFALGQVIGSFIEERLALGLCTINAVFMDCEIALRVEEKLRASGYALTAFPALGRDGQKRVMLMVTVKRKQVNRIEKMIRSVAPLSVISVTSAVQFRGGTLVAGK